MDTLGFEPTSKSRVQLAEVSLCLTAKPLASVISHVQHFLVPAPQCAVNGNRVCESVSFFQMVSSFSDWPVGEGGALDKSLLQSRTIQSLTCVKAYFPHCGNEQGPAKRKQAKVVYWEFVIPGESAPITGVGGDSTADRTLGKRHKGKAGRLQVCPEGGCPHREAGAGSLEVGYPVSLVRGAHLTFSD